MNTHLKLSAAALQVHYIAAFSSATPSQIGQKNWTIFEAAAAEDQPDKPINICTASELRWALLNQPHQPITTSTCLKFKDVTFTDFVDLSNIECRLALDFESCVFEKGLSLAGAKIHALALKHCEVVYGIAARDLQVATIFNAQGLKSARIDLTNATVGGDLDMSGANIGSGLAAENGDGSERKLIHSHPPQDKLSTELRTYWSPNDEYWAVLAMDGIRVRGSVRIAQFPKEDPVNSGANVAGTLSLRSASISSALVLSNSTFGVDRAGNIQYPSIRAAGISVSGAVFLCGDSGASETYGQFAAIGALDFSFARLGDRILVGKFSDESVYFHSSHGNGRPYARIEISDATSHRGDKFPSALLLRCASISGGISIRESTINGALDIENATIGRCVDVIRSRIGRRFAKQDAMARRRITRRIVNKHRDQFDYSVYGDGARIADSLNLISSRFQGEISIIEAKIVERLAVSGCEMVARTTTPRPESAINARGVDLGSALFEHLKSLREDIKARTIFNGNVCFSMARVRDDFSISDTDVIPASSYMGRSTLDLSGVTLGGSVLVDGSRILGIRTPAIDLSNARIGRRWFNFGSEFEVHLPIPNPGNVTDAAELTVIRCNEASFGGTVELKDDLQVIRGTIEMVGVRIGHDLRFEGCLFGQPIALVGSKPLNQATGSGQNQPPQTLPGEAIGSQQAYQFLTAQTDANLLYLTRARIEGDFRWAPHSAEDPAKRLRGPWAIVGLQAAHVSRLHDDPNCWPTGREGKEQRRGYWRLDGFTYDKIHEESEKEDRTILLAEQDPSRFGLQPYDQLAQVLKASGLSTQAANVEIKRQNARRRRTWSSWLRSALESGRAGARGKFQQVALAEEYWDMAGRCDAFVQSCLAAFAALFFGIALWLTAAYLGDSLTCKANGGKDSACNILVDFSIQTSSSPSLDNFESAFVLGLLGFAAAIALLFPRLCPLRILVSAAATSTWFSRKEIGSILSAPNFGTYLSTISASYFLEGLTGHGYRLWRLVLFAVAMILVGAAFFNHANLQDKFVPSEAARISGYGFGNAAVDPLHTFAWQMKPRQGDDYPKFNALLYSVDLFVPFLEIHQESYWMLSGTACKWIKIYKIAHVIFGWMVLALFAASPFQIFRKS